MKELEGKVFTLNEKYPKGRFCFYKKYMSDLQGLKNTDTFKFEQEQKEIFLIIKYFHDSNSYKILIHEMAAYIMAYDIKYYIEIG